MGAQLVGLVSLLALTASPLRPGMPEMPRQRTVGFAVAEQRPLSVCTVARRASVIVKGRVTAIGPVIEVSSNERYSGGLFTPVRIEVRDLLKGSAGTELEMLVFGPVLSDGTFDEGAQFMNPDGTFRDAVFFV